MVYPNAAWMSSIIILEDRDNIVECFLDSESHPRGTLAQSIPQAALVKAHNRTSPHHPTSCVVECPTTCLLLQEDGPIQDV